MMIMMIMKSYDDYKKVYKVMMIIQNLNYFLKS